MPQIQIFSVEHRGHGERTEITDLYWFEENHIHWFDDLSTVEIYVDGKLVFSKTDGRKPPP